MPADIQIAFDCLDVDRMVQFWASALGYVVQPPPPGYDRWEDLLAEMGVPEDQWSSRSAIIDPEGTRPRVFFQQVPETKSAKNRVHLDVSVAGREVRGDERRDLLAATVQRLVGEGATLVHEFEEYGDHWVTMLDPEGNEFDVQ